MIAAISETEKIGIRPPQMIVIINQNTLKYKQMQDNGSGFPENVKKKACVL